MKGSPEGAPCPRRMRPRLVRSNARVAGSRQPHARSAHAPCCPAINGASEAPPGLVKMLRRTTVNDRILRSNYCGAAEASRPAAARQSVAPRHRLDGTRGVRPQTGRRPSCRAEPIIFPSRRQRVGRTGAAKETGLRKPATPSAFATLEHTMNIGCRQAADGRRSPPDRCTSGQSVSAGHAPRPGAHSHQQWPIA